MPVSKDVQGGFMIPEVESCKLSIREDILEANYYAIQVLKEFELDAIDLHYYFRNQVQHRSPDGIHWNATGLLKIKKQRKKLKFHITKLLAWNSTPTHNQPDFTPYLRDLGH